MNIDNKIKNIIENTVIQYRFSLDSIFLFGSRARGDFKEESDFDILLILKDELPMKERRNLAAEISKTLHNELKFTPFDVIVKSRKLVYKNVRNLI
ncbi:MAG: nucleotidyltransferase domain-containing protein [Candidatus Saccharicenans sp.]